MPLTPRRAAALVAIAFTLIGFRPTTAFAEDAAATETAPAAEEVGASEVEAVQEEAAVTEEESEEVAEAEPAEESQSLMESEEEGDASMTIKTALPQADDASGALVYEYPIRIPPGRNGLQPDLKLTYTNQASGVLGWFGHGWDISIPSIERIAKRGSNKLYSDSTFNSSLTGELVMTASGTYVTRYEGGDFLSYAFNGTSWTVKDKKGLTYLFGSASSSRMDASGTNSWIVRWMISEIRDTNDNYIKYEYYKDAGQIYPSRILYTGHGSTDGPFEIEFARASRSDHPTQYQGQFSVTTNYRISEIHVKVDGVWTRKYMLGYTTGDAGYRTLLQTITETGRDELTSVTTSLPAQNHAYQTSTAGWTLDSNFAFPKETYCWDTDGDANNATLEFMTDVPRPNGVKVADVNGDGLADILLSRYHDDGTGCNYDKAVHINKGDGTGWMKSTTMLPPMPFVDSYAGKDYWGAQIAEVNGDGLADIIYSGYFGTNVNGVYINNGNGWSLDASYVWPEDYIYGAPHPGTPLMFADSNGYPQGVRVADVNGDSLSDLLKYDYDGWSHHVMTWINKGDGTGWERDTRWSSPVPFSYSGDQGKDHWNAQIADLNNDGLEDVFWSKWSGGSSYERKFYLNNGNGWESDSTYSMPDGSATGTPLYFSDASGIPQGVRVADLNGDGFPDMLQSIKWESGGGSWDTVGVYINKGDGTGWNRDLSYVIPVGFLNGATNKDNWGAQLIDVDGDVLPEIIWSGTWLSSRTYGVHVKNGLVADDLSRFTYPHGGKTDVAYKGTAEYRGPSSAANPNLPYSLQVVQKTVDDDGFGTTSTKWRYYEGGKTWRGGPFDHRFAGFSRILESDTASNTRITFFHQGDASATSTGEYLDHYSKIGRAYRTEIVNSSSNTMLVAIDRWNRTDNGTSTASFVHRTQRIKMAYDGDADHKERAESYAYDTANGNLSQRTFWGEVTYTGDGAFTDTGTDKRVLDIAYATNTTDYVIGLPSKEFVTDYGGAKVRETKYYYDNEAFGGVDEGNLTKEERWKSSSSYIDTEKTYDTKGLVTQEKDPRDKTTTYAYDAYSLYPATVTNPAGHIFQRTHDYSSGLVRSATDANLLATLTLFDGLDRPVEEKQPDQSTSSTSVTKTSYAYVDTALAANVKRTDWLDGLNGVDTWTYLDGLDRPIQVRKESEASNVYAASDLAYDSRALLLKESLPYFSSGSSKTTATTNADLYTLYTYDAMGRVTSATNAVGTVTNAYDDWKQTTTDARGKVKHLYRDAYDRLSRVDEVNGAATYATLYEYDGNDGLTKITDALSNVRNFTYDGLGRRLTAQDLHAIGDGTYGTWTYTYDDAGNPTTVLDPKSQTINYTYDDLNRPLTEDYTGQAGTEAVFTYEACQYGKGKLCSAATASATTTSLYGPTGQMTRETKTISGTSYQTDYTYDRQGNMLSVTLPDGAQQQNGYNNGGVIETVERKESGDGAWTSVVSNFDWSPLGMPTSIVFANSATTTNGYDASKLYRLTSKITTIPGGSKLQDLAYTYDANGNVTRIIDASDTNSAKTVDFSYDDLNRLTGATSTNAVYGGNFTQSYVYDAIGNMTSRSDVGLYGYDATGYANPHAATTIGGVTYGYDNNGNLTSSASDTYAWDFKNRLLTAFVDAATSTYAYDHAGDRVSQTTSASTTAYASRAYSTAAGVPTKHLFAGPLLVATVEGSTSSAVVRFIHTDHLTGSSVVTSATGTQVELLDYYPYGGIRIDEQATGYSEARKFAGHEYDVGTGLSYMGARYYDPALGRFLSEDPVFISIGNIRNAGDRQRLEALLSDPQQLNSYAYARNNPLAYVDPDGNIAIPAALYGAYLKAGDWGNRVYASNSAAAFVMDHPYVPAAIGAAPLAAYGAVAAAPAVASGVGEIASSIGAERGIRAGVGATLNISSTYLNGKVEGRDISGGEYAYSALTGAGLAVLPGGLGTQALAAGGTNWLGQAQFKGSVDPFSVGISTVSGGLGSMMTNVPGMTQIPKLFTQVTEQAVGWTIETPAQVMSTGIQRSMEDKRKRK